MDQTNVVRTQWGPLLTLLILSPVISNVLFGAVKISTLFVLVLLIGTWGCAALLIRHAANKRGYFVIFILGMTLAIAEEILIQQTSVAPLIGVDPTTIYSRNWDVNWMYLIWAVGYESVWVVVIPIQLIELMYKEKRNVQWINSRGLVFVSIVFLIASFIAWYSWTQIFIPQYFPSSVFTPPLWQIVSAISIISILFYIAFKYRFNQNIKMTTTKPKSQIIKWASFLVCTSFCSLVLLAYGVLPNLNPLLPELGGIILVILSIILIQKWSRSSAWSDEDRLALITGAIYSNMLVGFGVFILSGIKYDSIDFIGKSILNVFAVVGLYLLSKRVKQNNRFSTHAEWDEIVLSNKPKDLRNP
ncbi:MAG: hypothetical protein ABL895_05940 [Cyclobacteriaceae bacterium]